MTRSWLTRPKLISPPLHRHFPCSRKGRAVLKTPIYDISRTYLIEIWTPEARSRPTSPAIRRVSIDPGIKEPRTVAIIQSSKSRSEKDTQ